MPNTKAIQYAQSSSINRRVKPSASRQPESTTAKQVAQPSHMGSRTAVTMRGVGYPSPSADVAGLEYGGHNVSQPLQMRLVLGAIPIDSIGLAVDDTGGVFP